MQLTNFTEIVGFLISAPLIFRFKNKDYFSSPKNHTTGSNERGKLFTYVVQLVQNLKEQNPLTIKNVKQKCQ